MAVLKRCQRSLGRQQLLQKLPDQLVFVIQNAWQLKWQLLSDLWALILVPLLFAAFVIWNGGIVLGDKAAHAPVKHFMQPLYFALFAAGALSPYHFNPHR